MKSQNTAPNHSNNAFDFLRLFAASAVLFSHSFALYGLPEPESIGGVSFGALGVGILFAISGFLVCQSWNSDPSVLRFSIRRGLRIFPGLIVMAIAAVIVVGPLFSRLSPEQYFSQFSTWAYIPNASLLFRSVNLPGLFENNPLPKYVNGSLWTLRYEVLMYAWLAIGGTLLQRKRLGGLCMGSFIVCALL